jgi:hypothetical protein
MTDRRGTTGVRLPLLPRWVRSLLALGALCGVVYFSIVPPPGSGSVSRRLFGVVPYDTTLHFVSYAGLAIVFAYASYHSSRPAWQLVVFVFTATVTCGVFIEGIQYTLATRTSSTRDILVNAFGAGVGVVVWRALDRFVRFYRVRQLELRT